MKYDTWLYSYHALQTVEKLNYLGWQIVDRKMVSSVDLGMEYVTSSWQSKVKVSEPEQKSSHCFYTCPDKPN